MWRIECRSISTCWARNDKRDATHAQLDGAGDVGSDVYTLLDRRPDLCYCVPYAGTVSQHLLECWRGAEHGDADFAARYPKKIGGAAYWRHHAKRFNTVAGADTEDIHGTSKDYSYFTGILTPSGGTLLEHGLFAQGDVQLGPARFFAGVRHQFTGQHGDTFVSPNGGVTVGIKKFRLRASGYRSFRAPTLNELYRPFRVGKRKRLQIRTWCRRA